MKFRLQCPSVKFSWNSPPPIPSHAAWGSLGAQKLHQEPHGPQSLRYLLTGSLQRKFATHSLGWENLGCGETEPRRGSRRLGPEQSGVYTNKACFLLGSKGPPPILLSQNRRGGDRSRKSRQQSLGPGGVPGKAER